MNERLIAVPIMETGTCAGGAWTVEFPFPTQLVGIKHSGSDGSKTSTVAVSGGATVTAAVIGNSGNPTWTEPDSTPDYADADVAYVVTVAAETAIDDPYILLFFLIGDGAEPVASPGERIIAVTAMQVGDCVTAAWVVEFPFPTRFIGCKHSGTGSSKTSTVTLAGGAAFAATTISNSANPVFTEPTTAPDYAAADTAYTVTFTSATAIDDPLAIFFFAVGESSGFDGIGERVIVTNIQQTGSCTTAGFVQEFPYPVTYLGSKASGSGTSASTLQVSGGAVDAAATIAASGNPSYLEPTTSPDPVAADTAVTFALVQSGTRADDPMIVSIWQMGEG